VAEWLGCQTLNQMVVGTNPGEGTCICEQDTLKSTARGSYNCLRHSPVTSVKKVEVTSVKKVENSLKF
jgi:hypothetical protein